VSGWPSPKSYSGTQRPPHPAASLAGLAVIAAACAAACGVFLPWIRWGFASDSLPSFSFTDNMWVVVKAGYASEMGAGWMIAITAGMALALAASIFEIAVRPAGRIVRVVILAGFGLVVLGSCAGIIVGVKVAASTSPVLPSMTPSLDLGFWLALAIAGVGVVLAAMLLDAPPTPARVKIPFGPSPWGPLPGIPPAGFYPTAEGSADEYVTRGQVPPGYVPPSYGPPVMPSPGYLTPAYLKAGSRPPGLGALPAIDPALEPPDEPADGVPAERGPAPGHVVVLEAGATRTIAVEPGQRLLVGRDEDAEIRVSDRKVSERHATIERRGEGWAVQDVDAVNPTRLVDQWGMNRLVRGEIEVASGQLAVGDVLITLYPIHG
jgi:hypothetical protein